MKKMCYLLISCLLFTSLFTTSCSSDLKELEEGQKEKVVNQSHRISIQQAKKITLGFLRKNNKSKAKGLPVINESNLEEVQTLVNERNLPVLYVLNLKNNNGYVVLSASILERPILAYSMVGNFDLAKINDFEGVKDWLVTKFVKIEALDLQGLSANEEIAGQWSSLGFYMNNIGVEDPNGNIIDWQQPILINETVNTYGPHLGDIKWDQRNTPSKPMYNNTVRYINCPEGTTPAGCVAVAMGQIMKYHNHPNIYNISEMYPYITEGALYNYQTLPAQNIASFLGHIGNSVNMNYSCNVSGAYSQNARNAFNTVYHYTTSDLQFINLNTLRDNLINNKPVYLSGYREKEIIVVQTPIKLIFGMSIGKTKTKTVYSNGHAWVADGYEEIIGTFRDPNKNREYTAMIADHIHMNWGWRGYYDGWYDYDSWQDVYANSTPYYTQFIYYQQMITDITPNK